MASPGPAKNAFQAAEEEDHALPVSKGNTHKGFLVSQALVRILALVSSFTALAILVTSKESIFIFGIRFDAYYSYASSYRFLMVVDVVVGSFSAVSLGALCLIGRSPSSRRCFCLFVHDVLVMLLMMSGCSAATAVGYVGKYGRRRWGGCRCATGSSCSVTGHGVRCFLIRCLVMLPSSHRLVGRQLVLRLPR